METNNQAPDVPEKLSAGDRESLLETFRTYLSVLQDPLFRYTTYPRFQEGSAGWHILAHFHGVIGFDPNATPEENNEKVDPEKVIHLERIFSMVQFVYAQRGKIEVFDQEVFTRRKWNHVTLMDFFAYLFGMFDERYSRFIHRWNDTLGIQFAEWHFTADYFAVIHDSEE